MNREKVFWEWYDEYFCGQQGEDSPYSFVDVKEAFKAGYQKVKGENDEKKR